MFPTFSAIKNKDLGIIFHAKQTYILIIVQINVDYNNFNDPNNAKGLSEYSFAIAIIIDSKISLIVTL